MANKKVSQLTSKPSVLTTDLFPIADPSTGQLFKTTISDLGTAIGSGVSSVNSLVGAVVLDTDDIQELVSPTNKWFTDTRARAALSASSPLAYNSGTGVFGIQVANGSQNGYLSSADWTTFNAKQDALINPITGTGTTNYIPKFTAASVLGNSNIQDDGSLITLGSNSYVNGRLAVGLTASVNTNLFVSGNITGGITSQGVYYQGAIQSDVTTSAIIFRSNPSTQATSFTLPNLFHFQAVQGTIGAGSSITTQIGFSVDSSMIGATNNWGFRGVIPSGTGRWNLYMDGTANNYLAGNLLIGATNNTGEKLQVTGSSIYNGTITMNGGGVSDNPIQLVFNTAVNRLLTPVLRLYGATNIASNYVELLGTNATANRIINFPNASGTVALTSDLTAYLLKSGGTLTGKVNVSVDLADYGFTVTNTNTSGYGMYIQAGGTNNLIDGYNSTGATNTFRVGGTGVIFSNTLGTGLVYSNAGSLTSTNPSDSRLKSDIKTITYGLKDILKLRPVSYNWKEDNINQGLQFGFIAQEVQEIMPDAIKEFGDETKFLGLEKDAIYATLVNAIKELKAELDTLKNK